MEGIKQGEHAAIITKMVQLASGLNKFCCQDDQKEKRDELIQLLVRAVRELLAESQDLPVVTLCNVLSDLCFDAHPSKVGSKGQLDLKRVELGDIHQVLMDLLVSGLQ